MNTLKMSRMMAGLTQLELARLAGLSEQHITRIETGRRIPPAPVQERLARALSVPVTDLFPRQTGSNGPKGNRPKTDRPIGTRGHAVWELRREKATSTPTDPAEGES
jgi:transcriptional regulator with XRE-family HTH domain